MALAAMTAIIGLVGHDEASGANKPAPQDARAYIIWPKDGMVIEGGRLWVRMGLSGIGVAPAGVPREDAGHHHLILNADIPPLDEPIPNTNNYLHFGAGQTEARLELPPGEHTIQMILGDEAHMSFDPPIVSEKITIIVP